MTPIDRALQSRNAFLAFTGIITAVAAWNIWGGDMFPANGSIEDKSKTSDPTKWSEDELKRWLEGSGVEVEKGASREELLDMVREVMKSEVKK